MQQCTVQCVCTVILLIGHAGIAELDSFDEDISIRNIPFGAPHFKLVVTAAAKKPCVPSSSSDLDTLYVNQHGYGSIEFDKLDGCFIMSVFCQLCENDSVSMDLHGTETFYHF